ncbi:MAG: phosphate signaling complex protein PhoU [Nitrosomonas sp.]|nr:phosphate signaling complex protein PhoU [Nitrosomonas sp.]
MPDRLEGHTFRRFDGELDHLHVEILEMTTLVFEQIQKAIESFQSQDQKEVHAMIEREFRVNILEKKIDSSIIEVLAKRGPVARDLRAIMGFSKMVTDLERMNDEAVRIAHISTKIYPEDNNRDTDMLREIDIIGNLACTVLQEVIEILKTLDLKRARKLLIHNDLDEEFNTSLRRLTTYVLEDALKMKYTINIILVLKSLERIDNHARNLAEYVIYMVSGDDIRHVEDYR